MKRLSVSLAVFCLVAVNTHAHEPVQWGNATYQIVLSAEKNDGKAGMFTVTVDAPGGPPMHIHEDADEYFYLLDGSARFQVDGESVTLEAGEAAWVPRGKEHTYRILSEDGPDAARHGASDPP